MHIPPLFFLLSFLVFPIGAEDFAEEVIEEFDPDPDPSGDNPIETNPEQKAEKEENGSGDSARMRHVDLENFCFGQGDSFPLGPCSSTFLKCGIHNANRPFSFEECPMGTVFVDNECKQARKVRRDCFQPEVNLLNDATEKLAKAVDFCDRHNPFDAVLHFFDGPLPEHKCSRQALICRGTATQPISISCPEGKVLNPKRLVCEEAAEQCAFVPGTALTPIRQHLLLQYCAQSTADESVPSAGQELAPLLPRAMMRSEGEAHLVQNSAGGQEERCRNWYAVCKSGPEPEMVFCDNGRMFDPIKRLCRRILPEDGCPFIGVCRGWEWRMSPIGECRRDFLFCNGIRPQLFQCEKDGEVFRDGECKAASGACDVCQSGQMKRSTDKCEEFFFCELDTASGRFHWRQYICTNNRVFDPQRKECVSPDSYKCPTRTQCTDGDSYSVECGDFFACVAGKFVPGKCPDMTRWDVGQRRCIYSAECRRFRDESEPSKGNQILTNAGKIAECVDGQTKPSADCKQYDECAGGRWKKRNCRDYASNRLKNPCRFCSQPSPLSVIGATGQQSQQVQQQNIYPLERLLPTDFNPFEGQGVRHRRCIEGEKIVQKKDCSRFMECIDGDWFSLVCPQGHYFDPRSQTCVMASSSKASAMPMCQDLLSTASATTNPGTQTRTESLYLLPIVPMNDIDGGGKVIGPGAGPMPELVDKELRRNYAKAFDFCDQLSPHRLINPYDCSRFRECALDKGGYYTEKQCAPGAQFDPAQMQCIYNYTCIPPKCVEGIQEPLQQCGRARVCRDGKWHEFTCPRGMAFVGGSCSHRLHCQSTNPSVSGQCINGHTRAHPKDCSKYFLCRFGQFMEENCYNGHRYNPTIGRCDPVYDCPSDRKPPCYEGEMRALTQQKSTKTYGTNECRVEYELCRDRRFERMSCPYGEHFDTTAKRCVVGNCEGTVLKPVTGTGGGEGGGLTKTNGQQKCKESAGPQGFRSDRQNCAKFYQCAQGKWVPKDCAKGTVFNPAIGVCDWPANVPGC